MSKINTSGFKRSPINIDNHVIMIFIMLSELNILKKLWIAKIFYRALKKFQKNLTIAIILSIKHETMTNIIIVCLPGLLDFNSQFQNRNENSSIGSFSCSIIIKY